MKPDSYIDAVVKGFVLGFMVSFLGFIFWGVGLWIAEVFK